MMIMKKYYISILALLLLAACVEQAPSIEGFEADLSTIEAEAHGGSYCITIRSEDEWYARTDAPWVMMSPANGRGEVKCTIKVDSTLEYDVRNTTLFITSTSAIEPKMITINQHGYPLSITPETSMIEIAASAIRQERWVEFDVTANVDFEVSSNESWVVINDNYALNLDRGARPRTTRLHLDWKMNSEPMPREATLTLTPKVEGDTAQSTTIKVCQMAAPAIEDNRQGDSLAVVTIFNKMECWGNDMISTTEPMNHWSSVRLWESTDKLPTPEAVGRVRDLDLSYFNTEDDIPVEIKHLKYLETLSLYGNVNTMIKSIGLCPEVATLEHLKDLRIAAMGLVSLPENFAELGDTLESLDLNSNNFNEIPKVITKKNFPKLRSLDISSNRRASISDLSKRNTTNDKGIGIYNDMNNSDVVKNLFLWEELESLVLSYNYIEGSLPDFKVGEDGVRAYEESDIQGDTLKWAVENKLPRILPNMKDLRINLNFMTGELPDWLLYHPRLLDWGAEVLIYPQQEKAVDSQGNAVGFSNVPTSPEYFFEAYPLYRNKYEYNEEME